jgi:hypothetical protein
MTPHSLIARRDFLRLTGVTAGSLAVAPAFPVSTEGIGEVPRSRTDRRATGANVCRWFLFPQNNTTQHFDNHSSLAEADFMAHVGLKHVRLCVAPKVIMSPTSGERTCFRRADWVLSALLVWLPPMASAEKSDLRGLGEIRASAQFFSEGSHRSSWVTFACQDADHAAICGSKFMADLLGFGGIKAIQDASLPGTVLGLEGAGYWLLGLDNQRCQVLFARTKDELDWLAKRAEARKWRAVPEHAYPRFLDCFDNAAFGVWLLGWARQPADLNTDFRWLQAQKLTAQFSKGFTSRR